MPTPTFPKRIFLPGAMLVGMLLACPTWAQAPHGTQAPMHGPGKRAERMQADLTALLNLDATQQAQLDQLATQHQAALRQLHDEYADELNAMRDQRHTLRDEHRDQLRQMLTPEQQALFDGWVRMQQARHQRHRNHHGPQPGPEANPELKD